MKFWRIILSAESKDAGEMEKWCPIDHTKHWTNANLREFGRFWTAMENCGAQKCDEVEVDGKTTLVFSNDYKRAMSEFNDRIGNRAP